jgi:predicted ATPase
MLRSAYVTVSLPGWLARVDPRRVGWDCSDWKTVTLLAGENGIGQSTIRKAIAAAIGSEEQGRVLSRLGEMAAN